MNTRTLRAIFAILIIATLAVRYFAVDARDSDFEMKPVVTSLLQSYGMIPRKADQEEGPGSPFSTLIFDAPGCEKPLAVALLTVTFEERAIIDLDGDRGNVRRFFYLDRTWLDRDRIGVFLVRAKHKALSILRLTPYIPSGTMLMTSEPSDCHMVEMIDWARIWDRRYHSTLQRR